MMKKFTVMSLLLVQTIIAHPPTALGKLIRVNDIKMHFCESEEPSKTQPTVILDTYLGGNLLEWSLVQPAVAKFAHVISFDRPGLGFSEPSQAQRTCKVIVEELRALLRNAQVKPTYILVGHSSGGINMQYFAHAYPEEVYGLILVDSSHEDQFEKLKELRDKFKYILVATTQEDVAWLPEALRHIYLYLKQSPQTKITTDQERKDFEASLQELQQYKNRTIDKPLIVITRGTKVIDQASPERLPYELALHDLWLNFQQDLLTKSIQGKQIIAHGCGHMIQRERPDIIIAAIREMTSNS